MASQSPSALLAQWMSRSHSSKSKCRNAAKCIRPRSSGMEFIEGVIGQASVVVVKCGVGMVNAATCAILIDRFGVGAKCQHRIAGSLDAAIEIGDVNRL